MISSKKSDPPGGTTGQVGYGTGWMRRPCRTQDPHQLSRSSNRSVVVAGANGADVVAVNIELANEAAAAIAAIVRAIVRSDRGADDCGADQACADAPAEAAASGLRLGGGGSEAATEGKRGQRESGNSGLDRHEKLHPVVSGPLWSACPVGRSLFDSGSNRRRGFQVCGIG